ncbi:MAG: hypothetical protein COA78_21355 [Blastopirellula sp.]|nr:MAG: hypothetical protein COA78_21355 [Blastopirellula sp.]
MDQNSYSELFPIIIEGTLSNEDIALARRISWKKNWPILLISLPAIILLSVVTSPVFLLFSIAVYYGVILGSPKISTVGSSLAVQITSDGLLGQILPVPGSVILWEDIRRASKTENMIIFYLPKRECLILPARLFPNHERWSVFRQFISERVL